MIRSDEVTHRGESIVCRETDVHIFDPFKPNLSFFPELKNVRIYEGTMRRGDVLYLPPGALHAIVNDEASFAITQNDIYPYNFEDVLDTCLMFPLDPKVLAVSHFRCEEVLEDRIFHALSNGTEEKGIMRAKGKGVAFTNDRPTRDACKHEYQSMSREAKAFESELPFRRGPDAMAKYAALKKDFMACYNRENACLRKNKWKFDRDSDYEFRDMTFQSMLGFESTHEMCAAITEEGFPLQTNVLNSIHSEVKKMYLKMSEDQEKRAGAISKKAIAREARKVVEALKNFPPFLVDRWFTSASMSKISKVLKKIESLSSQGDVAGLYRIHRKWAAILGHVRHVERWYNGLAALCSEVS